MTYANALAKPTIIAFAPYVMRRGPRSGKIPYDLQLYISSEIQAIWRSTQEAEGTPLERVQVVNSGARVQIPPSPLVVFHRI